MTEYLPAFLLILPRRTPYLKMLPKYVFLGFHSHATTVTELLSTREVWVTVIVIYNDL